MISEKNYDWRNYKMPLLVLLAVGVMLFCIDASVKSIFGKKPAILIKASKHSASILQEGYQRIAGLHVLRNSSGADEAVNPVLVYGLSTVRQGFDAQWLTEQTPGIPWMVFGGSGGSFDGLAYYAQPFVEDGVLSPALTVVAVHPAWAAGMSSVNILHDRTINEAYHAVLAGDLAPVKDKLKSVFWSLQYDNAIGMLFQSSTFAFKESLLRTFSVPVEHRFEPQLPPWQNDSQPIWTGRVSQGNLARQLNGWTEMGMFDPESYIRNGPDEVGHFEKLLHQFAGQSDKAVVVFLPEHLIMRERVPASAAFMLKQSVAKFNPNIAVIDMRADLEPQYFYDYAHLNESGKRQLSELLLAHLKAQGLISN